MNNLIHSSECSLFKPVLFEKSLEHSDYQHNVHCAIFCRIPTPLFENYVNSALVSMHMRFDGKLGFPGGGVKAGEDILVSLNRELLEEINWESSKTVTSEEYLFSHEDSERKKFFHFYAKEITKAEFEKMEQSAFGAMHFGTENLGMIRVPMFTMKDGRGFPTFLRNCFAGNARDQLLNFLCISKLMTEEEINVAIEKSQKALTTYYGAAV